MGKVKKKKSNKYVVCLTILGIFILGLLSLGYVKYQQNANKFSIYQKENAALKSTNEKLSNLGNADNLAGASTELRAQIEALNIELVALNEQKTTLTDEITKDGADLAAIEKKLKTTNDQYVAKKAELDRANRGIAKFAQLKTEFNSYKTNSSKLSSYLTTGAAYFALGNYEGLENIALNVMSLIPQVKSDIEQIETLINEIESGNF